MGEAIDDTGANATARHATGNYRGINAVLSEKRGGRRVKENRWASFTENKVVIRIRGLRFDLGTRIAIIKRFMQEQVD